MNLLEACLIALIVLGVWYFIIVLFNKIRLIKLRKKYKPENDKSRKGERGKPFNRRGDSEFKNAVSSRGGMEILSNEYAAKNSSSIREKPRGFFARRKLK